MGLSGSLVYVGYRLLLAPTELQFQHELDIRLHTALVIVNVAYVLVAVNARRTSTFIRCQIQETSGSIDVHYVP